ncbi:hypothetical protein DdX_17702 [Ditylenchus destructor]|uniref:Uncharacterized protein n=1 Tax=Ditylenchus destructor TaxID=166010 RepID=A0AAD4MM33_9BILA|nr:hypothetical protein DdX_17702 [Ditylenchus destructor]
MTLNFLLLATLSFLAIFVKCGDQRGHQRHWARQIYCSLLLVTYFCLHWSSAVSDGCECLDADCEITEDCY